MKCDKNTQIKEMKKLFQWVSDSEANVLDKKLKEKYDNDCEVSKDEISEIIVNSFEKIKNDGKEEAAWNEEKVTQLTNVYAENQMILRAHDKLMSISAVLMTWIILIISIFLEDACTRVIVSLVVFGVLVIFPFLLVNKMAAIVVNKLSRWDGDYATNLQFIFVPLTIIVNEIPCEMRCRLISMMIIATAYIVCLHCGNKNKGGRDL